MSGDLTGQLGERLKEFVDKNCVDGLKVYHDHGPNRILIEAYRGEKRTDSNTLAEPDIAIVLDEPGKKKLLILAELEETSSKPKTVIGDCSVILLSEHIIIGGRKDLIYEISGSTLIFGFVVNEKGSIEERTKALLEEVYYKLDGRCKPSEMLSFIDYDKDPMLKKVESGIKKLLEPYKK